MLQIIIRWFGLVIGRVRAEYRQIANRYWGHLDHFEGNATEVCQQVLDRLWEGDFYRTSLGHFDFFWMRDFGTVSASLVHLGYTNHVHHTLKWALSRYRRAGRVSTCIDKKGNCFQAPSAAIDSLPWLLHSLVVSHYPLNHSEHEFLARELRRHAERYLDQSTGMVRTQKYSEMRDAVMYDRSAYAVALVGHMMDCADKLGLNVKYPMRLYQDELRANYWNGHHFNADRKSDAFSAECALMPFFLGVIRDEEMAHQTLDFINAARLNEPYPLRYTNRADEFDYHWWMTAPWMPEYQGNTLWSWHGEFYLHLLKRYKRPEYSAQLERFAEMIELHGNFPEMLNLDGSWYNAPVYRGDPGMVWVALFLELTAKKQSVTLDT